jgi:hypothetical protein
MKPRRARVLSIACLALLTLATPVSAGMLDDWLQRFADSDIELARSSSNVPFLPLAYLSLTRYNDIEARGSDGTTLSFDQNAGSQGAALPLLLGPRDMLVIGESVNWASFESDSPALDSFDVVSAGVPVAWLRQINPAWQTAAFAFPLAHKASLASSSWHLEVMAGAYARYVQREDLWWAVGVFADVGPGENTYLP